MQSLLQATRTRGLAGSSLPEVWPELEQAGARIRRGQVTLAAAGPGGGKSVLAETLAIRADIPTLYFSADSDAYTMTTRAAAMITGHMLERVQATFEIGNGPEVYGEALDNSNLRLDFSTSLTTDDMGDSIEAFAIAYGQWPELVVVDNLKNVWQGDADNHVGFERTLDWLHDCGRETGAAILVLHHLTGAYEDGLLPPPLSALTGKVGKTPEMILTLYKRYSQMGTPMLGVCIVKNRGSKADASGAYQVAIPYAPQIMRLGDLNGERWSA